MTIVGLRMGYVVRGQNDEAAWTRLGVAFERYGRSFATRFGEEFFPIVEGIIEAEVAAQFQAEGRGPARGRWRPLSPRYAAQKGRLYPGRPTLVRTGALMQALTGNGAHALRTRGGTEFKFGTSGLPYASFHQLGAGSMPDRPLFDFTDAVAKSMRREGAALVRRLAFEAGLIPPCEWRGAAGTSAGLGAGGAGFGATAGVGVGFSKAGPRAPRKPRAHSRTSAAGLGGVNIGFGGGAAGLGASFGKPRRSRKKT